MTSFQQSRGLSPLQTAFGGLGIIGGIWLILAPFVLNYSGAMGLDAKTKKLVPVDISAVTVSDIICGILLIGLVGFALLTANNPAMARIRLYASVVVIAVGVYLIAAPYVFDLLKLAEYLALDKPNTNDQLIGILTVVIAGFALQNEFLPNDTRSGVRKIAELRG